MVSDSTTAQRSITQGSRSRKVFCKSLFCNRIPLCAKHYVIIPYMFRLNVIGTHNGLGGGSTNIHCYKQMDSTNSIHTPIEHAVHLVCFNVNVKMR